MKQDDDFNAMFLIVDATNKGFLTSEEVADFYQTLFCHDVGLELANAVVKKVCSNGRCTKEHFQHVLTLMEEWRIRDENAYWDFKSLDRIGQDVIPQSSALLLAKSYKKDNFSLEEWNAWKNSRMKRDSEISWSLFKDFMYFESDLKPDQKIRDSEFEKVYNTFASQEVDEALDNYHFYKASLESDETVSAQLLKEKQMYHEDVQDESSRLVNRWNIGGVEAVIHDDGMEWEAVDDGASKNDVTVTEVLSAMDEKYEILREKLLWEMTRTKLGNDNPHKKITHGLIEEEFMITKSKEKNLRKTGTLEKEFNSLNGFDVIHGSDLHMLMGETAEVYQVRWEEVQKRYAAYKSDGKTPAEINQIFELENLEKMKNSKAPSGYVLVELWKRQQQEKQHILNRLKAVKTGSERLSLYTSLYRQCERAKEGLHRSPDSSNAIGFDANASSVAVAERKQVFDPTRYLEDTVRQEMIAFARLLFFKKKATTLPDVGDRLKNVSQTKNLGNVDSWMEITKLLEKKHAAERDMLIHFLHNMGGIETNIKNMNNDEMDERKYELSENFESWKKELSTGKAKEAKASQRPYQLALIHEGVALYKEQLRKEHSQRKPTELSTIMLGQLQTLQDVQFQEMQDSLRHKTSTEIYQVRKLEYRAIRDEHFDNIANLIFASEEFSEEEIELNNILLQKYNALRERLFLDHVKRYYGNEDKEKMLNGLREEEKKCRGSREQLLAICQRLKIAYSAKELLGPLHSRFESAVAANSAMEKVISIDEMSLLSDSEENILVELDLRYKDECTTARNHWRQTADKTGVLQRIKDEQLWLQATLEGEKPFLASAIVMGLLERAKLAKHKIRLQNDTQRFLRCTQERFALPEPFDDESAKIFVTENSNSTSALQFLLNQHSMEWKNFRNLMNDVTADELREAASLMTSDERVKRLAEINSKRKTLDANKQDDKEDLLSLLEEAAALKHVVRKEILRTLTGDGGAKNEDVFISLLADLQQEQLNGGLYWFDDVMQQSNKEDFDATASIQQHIDSFENLFRVLCKYEGLADDEHLLQALEDKYDTLRDKLLSDALMRQMGEEEWKRLSERERQERLMRLKLEERRLRREGKLDELARLLGDAFANDIRMKELLGESREEYERRLRERLAARKRGEALSEEDLQELATINGSNNPLLDLASNLDAEKAALLRMLSDQDNIFLSEKERQAALLRLRQAQMRAASEERYEAAALVSGLIDRQNAAEQRLKSDRERMRELARKRLEELRKKPRGLPVLSEEDAEIVRDGDRLTMEDAIFKKLRFLQAWERVWLASLLNDVSDPYVIVSMMSSLQVVDKLQSCKAKVPDQMIVLDQHKPLLADAALYRQAVLARHVTPGTDQSRDEIKVTLLADLQESQDKEEKVLTETISEMDTPGLVEEQEKLISCIKSGSSKAVPRSLFIFSTEVDVETEVLDALNGKYQAVIDSLAASVLPDKVGKSNWDNMSPDERRTKIADLSSQIRDLMDAGRFDDALDLLTEGLTEEQKQDLINSVLGDVDEKRRLDRIEREQRMEERIKKGMSPEEAQRLFDEEGLLFEKQEKKRRKNILEGLAMDLEAERDALLKALKNAKDKHEAEKERQALLAKLRLQERLLRREEKLSAISKILAMSRDRDDAIEKERQRQLKLARERLEAAKRRRELGLPEPEEDDIELRMDSDDVVVLADAVVREMEGKHAAERTALIKLMLLSEPGTEFRTKAEKLSSRECKSRIRDLREMRRQWRNEDPQTLLESKDEHWEMLQEASALQMTSLCSMKSMNEDDGQTFLLADLQAEQKKETTYLLAGLLEKNPASIRMTAEVQRAARLGCWYDNVAGSLLGASSKRDKSDGEAEVVKALEDKYDALKDKLLAEALMKKLGEKEWAALSEKERQRRIMQIKQREKKLRREGKYDELAKLFSNLAVTEQDIDRIFGEQRLSQEEELRKRKERIRQLREERIQKGLAVDDVEILKQVDEEENAEKQKRTNILLTLDQNLEAEREALLSDLRRKEDSVTEERRRQLAVAKLRRQRRQVEAEEKLSAIDYVLQTAKQDEEALQARYEENREKQKAMAMQRLAARKTQKQRKAAVASLTNPDLIYQKLKSIANEKDEGSSTEQLLYEMEKKQLDEKDFLTLLLLAAEHDETKQQEVKNMDHEKLNEGLELFYSNRRKWREERMMRAISESGDVALTDEQRKALSSYVSKQNRLLISALRYKLEQTCRETLEETDVTSLKDKISGEWMADLQHTQENEIKTTTDLIGDKSEEILNLLTQGQIRSRREAWIDNIGKVVFGLVLPGQEQHRPSSSSSSLDQEVREMEADAKEKMSDYERELVAEKKKIQRKKVQGEDIDTEAAFANLEKQFADKKAALSNDLERQRRQIGERLRERRQRRDESEYEAHAAMGMVMLAEQRLNARESRTKDDASKQRNLMQERLAARKAKRKLEQEQKLKGDDATSDDRPSSVEKKAPSPFDALRREKTVVPVNVSEQDREKVLAELHKRTIKYQEKIENDKAEQQKLFQKRLDQARERKVTAAGKIIHQHVREKTFMEERKSKTLERQKTMLGERIGQLRYERTMTMKENQKRKSQNFSKLVDDGESGGLDKNEKMEKYATELQKKLVQEGVTPDEKQPNPDDDGASVKDEAETSTNQNASDLPPKPQTASRKLDQQERGRIMKQRMKEKKNRKEKSAQEEEEKENEE